MNQQRPLTPQLSFYFIILPTARLWIFHCKFVFDRSRNVFRALSQFYVSYGMHKSLVITCVDLEIKWSRSNANHENGTAFLRSLIRVFTFRTLRGIAEPRSRLIDWSVARIKRLLRQPFIWLSASFRSSVFLPGRAANSTNSITRRTACWPSTLPPLRQLSPPRQSRVSEPKHHWWQGVAVTPTRVATATRHAPQNRIVRCALRI